MLVHPGIVLFLLLAFNNLEVRAQSREYRCCYGDENLSFSLGCPSGTNISSVDFASWGTPTGHCTAYSAGSCHADVSSSLSFCLGQSYCEFIPSSSFFGVEPCPDVPKHLAVQWSCAGVVERVNKPLPATPPLSTRGRYIVDATGRRFKIAAVNWYGAQCKDFVPNGLHITHIRDIASSIKAAGFNAVRLQWSNELVQNNPIVEEQFVAGNPQLIGLRALDIYTAAVEALNDEGVFVILDNHMSDAEWCCNIDDQNGLWYNKRYSEETFFSHWEFMVNRYKNYPNVIAAELRNELRASCGFEDEQGNRVCKRPTWGGQEDTDWKRAATIAANRVLRQNSNLLVMISGLLSSAWLRFLKDDWVTLDIPNRLVYVAHDYAFWHNDYEEYSVFAGQLEKNWGFVVQPNQNWTNPLFISEFGTCNQNEGCVYANATSNELDRFPWGMSQGRWFEYLNRYLKEKDLDFSYWPWNGSTCKGDGRVSGGVEGYGIANVCWNGIFFPPLLQMLQQLQPPSSQV